MSLPVQSRPDTEPIEDADREHAAAGLREHVGAGRLDLADFDRRVGLLYAATTRSDLAAAFVDLPAAPVRRPTGAGRPDRSLYRLLQVTAFWGPFALVAVASVVIWFSVGVATGHASPFWPVWVIAPWGLTLVLGDAWWWGPALRRTGRRSAAAGR